MLSFQFVDRTYGKRAGFEKAEKASKEEKPHLSDNNETANWNPKQIYFL